MNTLLEAAADAFRKSSRNLLYNSYGITFILVKLDKLIGVFVSTCAGRDEAAAEKGVLLFIFD